MPGSDVLMTFAMLATAMRPIFSQIGALADLLLIALRCLMSLARLGHNASKTNPAGNHATPLSHAALRFLHWVQSPIMSALHTYRRSQIKTYHRLSGV